MSRPLSDEALAELDAIATTTKAVMGPTFLSANLWRETPIYRDMVARGFISWAKREKGSLLCAVRVLPAGHAALHEARMSGQLARAIAAAEAREAAEAAQAGGAT